MKPTLVLDTCAFLDLIKERWTHQNVIDRFQETAHPVILSVTVWEISRKVALEKLTLPCEQSGILDFVHEVCGKFQLGVVSTTDRICHKAEEFPMHHRDPFDRMILALAKDAACPVVSTDRDFERYPVTLLRHRD